MLFEGVPSWPDSGVALLPLRGVNCKSKERLPDIDVKELIRVEKRVVEIKEAGRVRWVHSLDSAAPRVHRDLIPTLVPKLLMQGT